MPSPQLRPNTTKHLHSRRIAAPNRLLQQMVDLECERWVARLRDYDQGKNLRETLINIGKTFLHDMDDTRRSDFFKIIRIDLPKGLLNQRPQRGAPPTRQITFGVSERWQQIER